MAYPYNMFEAAAVIFAILYTGTCVVTIFQYFYYKSWFWFFMILASISQSSTPVILFRTRAIVLTDAE